MKKILMIAALMVATLSVSAQGFVKPMVGATMATVTGGDDTKMRFGAVFGAEYGYMINDRFGLTAGLLYSMQGSKIEDADDKFTTTLDYLNVPVLANVYVAPGLALKAGAQIGFLVNAKQDDIDVKDFCNKVDFSIPVGASYEISNFVIDARYNLGISKVLKKEIIDKSNHNSVFMLTLGYKLDF